MTRFPMAAAAMIALATPLLAESHTGPAAGASLMTPDGTAAGQVEIFETVDGGTLFQVTLEGLPEGWHGFHVHETGQCGDDFAAAGDHYQGDGGEHGLLAGDAAHAGDLPNVYVNAEGMAMVHVHSARLTLEGGAAPMMDGDGSAIIVHESPDSYMQEAGAGGRIACGVIEAM